MIAGKSLFRNTISAVLEPDHLRKGQVFRLGLLHRCPLRPPFHVVSTTHAPSPTLGKAPVIAASSMRSSNDGSLRLTSFAKCKKHLDEQRLDLEEGSFRLVTSDWRTGTLKTLHARRCGTTGNSCGTSAATRSSGFTTRLSLADGVSTCAGVPEGWRGTLHVSTPPPHRGQPSG
jgi:hypothetical protein